MEKLLTSLAALAVILVCFVLFPTEAQAAEVTSGTCGSNLTWVLDDSGTLTISGTGAMANYSNQPPPWWTYHSEIMNVVIENGVTTIGDYAFCDCESLTSITIPDSVTGTGYQALSNCGLRSVYITNPSAWCNIDFADTFYAGKEHILDANGQEVHEVVLDETVTSVPRSAFCGNSNLTSIVIPDSVTSIGEDAFYGCPNLTSITVDPNNTYYHSNGNCLIETESKTLRVGCQNSVIPADGSVTRIGRGAFFNCKFLSNITIPNSITYIGKNAFEACSNLTSITIPDSVTHIDRFAFSSCSLISITIPDSVIYLSGAFSHCPNLTSVAIGNGVGSIGDYTFYNCPNLTSLTIGDSVASIGDSAFESCGNLWHILYKGNERFWDAIHIGEQNRPIFLATIHYNCTGNEVTDPVNKVCILCTPACTHSYDNTCDTTCNLCGATRSTTHTPGSAATATTDQTCTVCGKVLNKATGGTAPTPPATQPTTPLETQPTISPSGVPTESTTPSTEPVTDPSIDSSQPITQPTEGIPSATDPSDTDSTQPENVATTPSSPEESKKDNTIVVVIIACAACLLLGAGGATAGIILWKKKH